MAQKSERRLSNADMFLCVGAALIATASFMLAVVSGWPTDPRVWFALTLALSEGSASARSSTTFSSVTRWLARAACSVGLVW